MDKRDAIKILKEISNKYKNEPWDMSQLRNLFISPKKLEFYFAGKGIKPNRIVSVIGDMKEKYPALLDALYRYFEGTRPIDDLNSRFAVSIKDPYIYVDTSKIKPPALVIAFVSGKAVWGIDIDSLEQNVLDAMRNPAVREIIRGKYVAAMTPIGRKETKHDWSWIDLGNCDFSQKLDEYIIDGKVDISLNIMLNHAIEYKAQGRRIGALVEIDLSKNTLSYHSPMRKEFDNIRWFEDFLVLNNAGGWNMRPPQRFFSEVHSFGYKAKVKI